MTYLLQGDVVATAALVESIYVPLLTVELRTALHAYHLVRVRVRVGLGIG